MKLMSRSSIPLVLALCSWLSASPPVMAEVSAPFLLENVETRRDFENGTDLDVAVLSDTTLLFAVGAPLMPAEQTFWRTDGTAEGTVAVTTGSVSALSLLGVTADRSRALFIGSTAPEIGYSTLYVTDGTTEGTEQLVPEGLGSVSSQYFDRATGQAYVFRLEGVSPELYVSDGTSEGTRLLFEPDESLGFIFYGRRGAFVYFSYRIPGTDRFRVFRTDGTAAGTIALDPEPAAATKTGAAGDRFLYFEAKAGGGFSLRATDGNPGHVVVLTEVDGLEGTSLTSSGDLAYFTVHLGGGARRLMVTDGTPAGTRALVEAPWEFELGVRPRPLENLSPFGEGSLFFAGYDDAHGIEPWVSDGTPGGTRLLADLCPGDCGSEPTIFAGGPGGNAYFTALDPNSGVGLYATDGQDVARIDAGCTGPCNLSFRRLSRFGSTLYFLAPGDAGDTELYRATGLDPAVRLSDFELAEAVSTTRAVATEDGLYFTAAFPDDDAVVLADAQTDELRRLVSSPVSTLSGSSYPSGLAAWQGDLFFTAIEGLNGLALFRKSGDAPSLRLDGLGVNAFGRSPNLARTLTTSDRLFVLLRQTAADPFDRLWVSDGTEGGASLLVDQLQATDAWVAGDRLFFVNRRGPTLDLWTSDGTPGGTKLFRPGVEPGVAAPLGDRLLYTDDGDLWLTDGTEAGTDLYLDLSEVGLAEALDVLPVDGGVFFVGREGAIDPGRLLLFFTDGTAAGTRIVSAQNERADRLLGLLGPAGKTVIYSGSGGLWATDPDGPAEQLGIPAPATGPGPEVGRLDGELWVIGFDGSVWRTDGTQAGSSLVLAPVADGFRNVFEIPGHLLFTTSEEALFATDADAMTLRRLRDFAQIGHEVAVLGDRAAFAADDRTFETDPGDAFGFELWAVEVGAPPPPPPPPGDLPTPADVRAEGTSDGIVVLWGDVPPEATRIVVEKMEAFDREARWEALATLPAEQTSLRVARAPGAVPALFRVRAETDDEASAWSPAVAGTRVRVPFSGCDPNDPNFLCLQNGRFDVSVRWRDRRSRTVGDGVRVPFDFSDDSGAFWFFDEDNIELVVKVLDARVINTRFWTFFGALSDVEYFVVVTDLVAGTNVTYYNPPEEICGQADTFSFPRPRPGSAITARRHPEPFRSPTGSATPTESLDLGVAGCVPDADTLCLTPDRYRVTVEWRDQRSGDTGVGHAIPGTEDSGYFWFFDDENVELVVKVLDATTVNGFVWVFYGALTDVEYTITVTDTATGDTKRYTNPPGNICGDADVRAF